MLICAHYDSIMEEIDNSEERAPGANDNASGVSAVLEVARILSQLDSNFSVQFAFFSGEEQGLWGSKNYARHVDRTSMDLHRLINLDMVGHPPSNEMKVVIERDRGNVVSTNDHNSQDFAQTIEKMATDYTGLEVIPGPIYDSDYMPFEALGHVVIGIYDGGEVNLTHHNKRDTPSTLNLDYITEVAKMVLATAIHEIGIHNNRK